MKKGQEMEDLLEAANKWSHLSEEGAELQLYASHRGKYGMKRIALAVKVVALRKQLDEAETALKKSFEQD